MTYPREAFSPLLGVHNVRNAEYFTYRDCVVDYYDKTYDLTKIQSVDFIVIPFAALTFPPCRG